MGTARKPAYVLAMYDVRGKQEFIFRTNKLKEIAGGSWIIRDVYEDYLYPAAERLSDAGKGIFRSSSEAGNPDFDRKLLEKHLEEGYLGEVVYEGGGNLLLIFRDAETFREVTYAFTKELMKEVGTFRVLGSYVEDVDFDHYQKDQERLREKHRMNEAQESIIQPWSCLPVVQVDRQTSQPIVAKDAYGDYSKETLAKANKYDEVVPRHADRGRNAGNKGTAEKYFVMNQKVFDELVEKKGEDSMLAVVYIDGNNMGAKVQEATRGCETYEECVKALRAFSEKIQKTYVEDGVRHALGNEEEGKFRLVIFAGDEINFVVNAHHALDCAKDYLEALGHEDGASACAGICVFHSHSPYADAYRIAEEACESGKKAMKASGLKVAAFIDYHLSQGAAEASLESIRTRENARIISRPWLVSCSEEDEAKAASYTRFADVERLAAYFRKIGRSNVKGLVEKAYRSNTALIMDLKRITAHMSDKKRKELEADTAWIDAMEDNARRNLIYDVAAAYDMWFAGEEGKAE